MGLENVASINSLLEVYNTKEQIKESEESQSKENFFLALCYANL